MQECGMPEACQKIPLSDSFQMDCSRVKFSGKRRAHALNAYSIMNVREYKIIELPQTNKVHVGQSKKH